MFIRSVKVKSSSGKTHEYVRIVEAIRNEQGVSRQKVVANLGRRDTLEAVLPQLIRFLDGSSSLESNPSSMPEGMRALDASTWGPMLIAHVLFKELDLCGILQRANAKLTKEEQKKAKKHGPKDWIDRALVLIASRLSRPSSEHALAAWLATDYVCDRKGTRFVPHWRQRNRVKVDERQLQKWYRTLDRLIERKDDIEVGLYHRLKDLFSLKPDLVFYDITSTYFEGRGPDAAKNGYSRDGKPRKVQVVVGVVMVSGWPIAHHVWEGNTRDSTTVPRVIEDLRARFDFERVVFVGDRGMVSRKNLEELKKAEGDWGFLLGLVRRRNPEAEALIDQATGEWIECPMGIAAREKSKAPKTRVQEVPCTRAGVRVFVVDSDERKAYEQRMRERSMQRSRDALDKVAKRVAEGRLKDPSKIGASVERAMKKGHGHRYWDWKLEHGKLKIFEHEKHLAAEKKYEGKYLIQTDQLDLSARDAVERYKQLDEVERAFRSLKNLLGLRPIFHKSNRRTFAHIFVAALAFLTERLLSVHLKQAGSGLSTNDALKALETIRHVSLELNGGIKTGVTPGNARAREVLNALNITDIRPPTPRLGAETKM